MNHLSLPQYLIESSICLCSFYALYYLLLKKETFFQFNRFYLLLTALISLGIPFLNFEWITTGNSIMFDNVIIPALSSVQTSHETFIASVEEPSRFVISVGDIIRSLYFLGLFIMSLKLFDALFKVFNMISKGRKVKHKDGTLVTNVENVPSSSFFSFIFWNINGKSNQAKKIIMDHELVHVRQWHSLDVIFMELMVILKWFNPLIYLFRRSLKLTHEYIADRYVSSQSSKYEYATVLLNQFEKGKVNGIKHTFYSDIKERLHMMSQSRSKLWKLTKFLAVIPIAFTLIGLFSFNFVDSITMVKEGMTKLNKGYDHLEATAILDVPSKWQDVVAQNFSDEKPVYTEETIIFRWGKMMYYFNPSQNSDEELYKNEIRSYELQSSLENKPMLFAFNTYWYDFEFDVIVKSSMEEIKHTIKVDESYDHEMIMSQFDLPGMNNIQVENIKLKNSDNEINEIISFDIVSNNAASSTSFNSSSSIRWIYSNRGSRLSSRMFPIFMGGILIKDLEQINKEGLVRKVKDNYWAKLKNDEAIDEFVLEALKGVDLDDYEVSIEVHRDIIVDKEFDNNEKLKLNENILREYISIGHLNQKTIKESFDFDLKNLQQRSILEEWFNTLDNGDRIFFIFVHKDYDAEEASNQRVPFVVRDTLTSESLDNFRLEYKVSEYPELYEPEVKLDNKFSSAKEMSKYQIIYQLGDKTLIKVDRMDPENEKILNAFSDPAKFEIIHIPGYTTQYRVIEYNADELDVDKHVIKSVPGLDEINIHRLPEFNPEDGKVELTWGKMISIEDIGNYSLKQFHSSRKLIPYIEVGSDRFEILRFTMYIIDKNDNVTAFQSSSVKSYELNSFLQKINEETSIYFDDIIIDKKGEWQHVMNRFSFVFE